MARVADIIDSLDTLPALPEAIARVQPMLSSGEYDVSAISQIIMRDEALAAAVLKRANSAHFNASGAVFDLAQSIARLGSRELVRIISACGTGELLNSIGRSYGLRRGHLARSAVGGAAIAQKLAINTGTADPGLAYTCALLRDIGKIIIDHAHPEVMNETNGTPLASECFLKLERDRFGADHAEIGAALAERWSLPAPIPASIRLHHEPPAPGHEDHDALFDIVHAADVICLWAGLAIGCDGPEYRVASHVRDGLLARRSTNEELISQAWIEAESYTNETSGSGSPRKVSA